MQVDENRAKKGGKFLSLGYSGFAISRKVASSVAGTSGPAGLFENKDVIWHQSSPDMVVVLILDRKSGSR
jgi:hypothetical protein